jgi:prophage regulatory protein
MPNSIIQPGDYFMRESEIESVTGLSRTTRWRLEKEGKFPKCTRLSPNAKGLLYSKCMAWVKARLEEADAD